MISRWWQQLLRACRGRPPVRKQGPDWRRSTFLQLEMLESRLVPSTWTVTNTSTSAAVSGSLAWAVGKANADTTPAIINFSAAAFTSATTIAPAATLTFNNPSQPITMDGAGAGPITISGNNSIHMFTVNSTVTVQNMSFTEGLGDGGCFLNNASLTLNNCTLTNSSTTDDGPCIDNHGTSSLTVNNCTMSDNSAPLGGCIMMETPGTLTVTNSTFTDNTASSKGGAICISNAGCSAFIQNCTFTNNGGTGIGGAISSIGTLTVDNCTLKGNSGSSGGAIYSTGVLTVQNGTSIQNNTVTVDGAGIYQKNSTLTVSNATITGNSGPGQGGAIFESSASLTVSNSTLTGNSAKWGGGIDNVSESGAASVANVTGCTITGNTASSGGGGLLNQGPPSSAFNGTMTVTNTTISGNSSSAGGGISVQGTVTVDSCTINGNTAGGSGGGINIGNGTLTVQNNTTLSGNTATTGSGGGIDITGGAVTVTGGTISNNAAPSANGYGGGINNAGTLTVTTNANITGNVAGNRGGGISNNGTTTVTQSTISGNSSTGFFGGGVDSHAGSVTLTNCTLDSNTAPTGGAISFGGTTFTITGSTLSNNTATVSVGGINDAGSVLTISGSTVSGNSTPGNVGGILNSGTATVSGTTISGNSAGGNGGGIYSTLKLTVNSNSIISGNTASGTGLAGGGIAITAGTALIDGSTITTNRAAGGGGGIANSGALTIQSNSQITSNVSNDAGGIGGGGIVASGGSVIINASTVSGNTGAFGGGIDNRANSVLTIQNGSTISGNSCNGGSGGGGIGNFTNVVVTVDNSTVTGNSSSVQGGGIYSNAGTVKVQNGSTISNNMANTDGGGLANAASLTITGSTVSGNSAAGNGGGVYSTSTLSVSNSCTISGNTAGAQGGGIFSLGSATGNLLTNPGAETGDLTGWTVGGSSNPGVDNGSFDAGINPHSGSYDFYGHTGAFGTLTQVVSLVGNQGITAAAIDTGHLQALVSFWQQSLNQGNPSDNSNVSLTFLNSAMATVGTVTSPVIDSHNLKWQEFTGGFAIPALTRYISYTMNFIRHAFIDLDSFIDDNVLEVSGTGLGTPATTTVSQSSIISNTAEAGGGISNEGATLNLSSNATVQNNTSVGNGAGIYNSGTLTVNNSTISGNSTTGDPSYGGGIYSTNSLTVTSSTISDNTATADLNLNEGGGGGISVGGGTATIQNSTVTANSVSGPDTLGGGGIYVDGGSSVSISNTNVTANIVDGGNGGGLEIISGSVTVVACALVGDSANVQGGAIDAAANATVNVTNATLSGNTATTGAGGAMAVAGTSTITNVTLSGNEGKGGGAVWFDGGAGKMTIQSATLSGNQATGGGAGGGILSTAGGNLVLTDTIVAGNVAPSSPDVDLQAAGTFNLIGDGTGMTGIVAGVGNNQVGTGASPINPLLGPLQNNGGTLQTMGFIGGSPAINAGAVYAGIPATDERGFNRIVNGVPDIGAVESQIVVAAVHSPQSYTIGASTSFVLGSFTDSDAAATSWTVDIDWGDGSAHTTFATTSTTIPNQSHTYVSVGPFTVTVTVTDSFGNAGQTTFQAASGVLKSLNFITEPPLTVVAGASLGSIQVQALDQFNNPVSHATIIMSMAGATLYGTLSAVTNASGIAIFANLSVHTAGTYQLEAADTTGTVTAFSTSFTVIAGKAAQLTYVTQPNNVIAGAIINPVTLQVSDKYGNPEPGSIHINVKLASGTPILGTLSQSTVNPTGQAVFNNLAEDTAGTYRILASTAGLASVLSSPFVVSAGSPFKVIILTKIAGVVAGNTLAPFTAVIEDNHGNIVPQAGIAIAITDSNGATAGSYPTDGTGHASISSWPETVSGTHTLTGTAIVSGSALTPGNSNSFKIATAAPILYFKSATPASTTAGAPLSTVIVQAQDTYGNPIVGLAITMKLSGGMSLSKGGGPLTTNAAGQATFNNMAVNKVGTYSLIASAAGAVSITTGSQFTISSGLPFSITYVSQPHGTLAGVTMNPVVIKVTDLYGNPVIGDSVTISSTSGSLSGTLTQTTGSNGEVTFNDLVESTPGTFTMSASGGTVNPKKSVSYKIT